MEGHGGSLAAKRPDSEGGFAASGAKRRLEQEQNLRRNEENGTGHWN